MRPTSPGANGCCSFSRRTAAESQRDYCCTSSVFASLPPPSNFGETSRRDRKRKRVLSIDTNGYQLKSQKSRLDESIMDGAYAAMMNAIRHDETPNFYFMQYELATWRVKNLLLVSSFAFPPSALIKRAPLSSTALR
ncbi:MAG: DpnI domain-containing protein [Verrucomicrobiota bacterium]